MPWPGASPSESWGCHCESLSLSRFCTALKYVLLSLQFRHPEAPLQRQGEGGLPVCVQLGCPEPMNAWQRKGWGHWGQISPRTGAAHRVARALLSSGAPVPVCSTSKWATHTCSPTSGRRKRRQRGWPGPFPRLQANPVLLHTLNTRGRGDRIMAANSVINQVTETSLHLRWAASGSPGSGCDFVCFRTTRWGDASSEPSCSSLGQYRTDGL